VSVELWMESYSVCMSKVYLFLLVMHLTSRYQAEQARGQHEGTRPVSKREHQTFIY
jgi:hypothetical protein